MVWSTMDSTEHECAVYSRCWPKETKKTHTKMKEISLAISFRLLFFCNSRWLVLCGVIVQYGCIVGEMAKGLKGDPSRKLARSSFICWFNPPPVPRSCARAFNLTLGEESLSRQVFFFLFFLFVETTVHSRHVVHFWICYWFLHTSQRATSRRRI